MTNLSFSELVALMGVAGLNLNERYYITDKGWTVIATSTSTYRKVNPIVTEVTYAELAALMAANDGAGELNLALSYKITDRGDRGLLFRAVAPNRLESDGIRYMLCPATYAVGVDAYDNDWIGVWNATKQLTATEGQLTIWNGLVWVAGATLSGDSPSTEASGWTVIPKASFTNHEYVEIIFGVTYDFANDWINSQWDDSNNILGMSKSLSDLSYPPEGDYSNYVDICDWNFATSGYLFVNNCCYYIYNNSNADGIYNNNNVGGIFTNSNLGKIANNNNKGSIYFNSNTGEISNNGNDGYISQNSNVGSISNNSNKGVISSNSNVGDIKSNSNVGYIQSNLSLSETTCSIMYNANNGNIFGSWDGDVIDPVVDKTGTEE